MSIGEICNRKVVIAERSASVAELARLMREYHVGDVVIVDARAGRRYPVGIVTDRDIVVGAIAPGLLPDTLTAGDLATAEVVLVEEGEGVFDTVRYMRSKGVRRVPVVDKEGALVGIVTLDDLLELLAGEMAELARLTAVERRRERQERR
jgi:CBS domain-containing protein